ncbi:hypothetical protein [Sphingobium agri]|uniref:hypothetical protein n=2 Tax=Sphingomonadaceae TaxID=41297 RepID=UPI00248C9362
MRLYRKGMAVALIGWMLSFAALLGALALRQDAPIGGSAALSNMLLLLALLACPMLWQGAPLGISRAQRVVGGLILLFCLPILLLPGAS